MNKVQARHIRLVLVVVGLFIVVLDPGSLSDSQFFASLASRQPLFDNTDSFVLFADRGITLEQETQVSSGDLGSNDKINIQKDNIINGNLFAKEITIDKDTQINGNASYNKPKLHKESLILGVTTTPVSLPAANLPDIPPFLVGTRDFSFRGENNVFNPGSYRNITLEKDSRLTLPGGTYNLNKFELKENSFLIYNSPTTVNIQSELKTRQHIAILPGNNDLEPLDLTVNYQGKATIDDDEDEDEDNNDNNNDDDGNDDENKKIKSRFQNLRDRFSSFFKNLFGFLKKTENRKDNGVKPVQFGNDSFLNFKLLAPKAGVKLGERITLRGQVLARKIGVGRNSILSRENVFTKDIDPAAVVTDVDGSTFPSDIIIVNFSPQAAFLDAQNIAASVGGRIVGFIEIANAYQIEVSVATIQNLKDKIQIINNLSDPLVEGAFRDYVVGAL